VWVTTAIKRRENGTYVVRFIVIIITTHSRTELKFCSQCSDWSQCATLTSTFDSKLIEHADSCSQGDAELRRLRQIRRLLGRDVTTNYVMAALVLTWLNQSMWAGRKSGQRECSGERAWKKIGGAEQGGEWEVVEWKRSGQRAKIAIVHPIPTPSCLLATRHQQWQ